MSRDRLRGSRPTIGLLSEVGVSTYYHELWAGFAEAALQWDVNLICYAGGTIGISEYGFDAQRNILYDLVSDERVDGLLVCGPIGNFISAAEFKSFVDRYRSLPMVGIAPAPELPSVVVDNETGVRDLVRHLIEVHGLRRIAFICGPEDSQEAAQRYHAYIQTVTEYGLPLDPDLVAPGAFQYVSGVEAIRLLLDERRVQFEAVVAANDQMALGALEELQARGIRVPEDVALGGFDDTREAAASRPSLTTVRQPISQLGQAGMELLLKLLAGEQVPEQTVLPARLVIRRSCGCTEPMVAHAAVGAPGQRTGSWRQVVATRREEILSEMEQALSCAPSSSAWAARLLDSFVREVEATRAAGEPGGEPAPQTGFLRTLDDLLQQTSAAGGPVDEWQDLLSVMRRRLTPHLMDIAALSRAEDLFNQGRVMIGQTAQWNMARRELDKARQATMLNYLSGDLAAVAEMGQLHDALVSRLPQLGFSTFYLSFYEGPERPARWSRLGLAYDRGIRLESKAEQERFLSQRLLPDELVPQDRRYTWVVEPLHFREKQFGYLILEAGAQQGELCATLSRQISSSIQDLFSVQQLESRSVQLATAVEVSRAAGSILDPDELIQQVVPLIRERFNLYYAGLFLVEEGGERPGRWAVLRAGTGEAGRQMLEQGHRLAVGGESMIGWCIANKQARIALDVGEEAIRFDNPLLPETRSEMALPLISRGQVIGALTIQSAQEAAFSREDIAALQTMADQLATAIANARLYQELAHEQSLLQALLDALPDHVYFKDTHSRFTRVSRSLIEAFGLDQPEQIVGKTDFDFFTEEHARPAYEDEQRIIRTGQPILGLEERETWPDRPDTWVLTSKLPLRDREGNIIGTFGISSDITARKRAEDALAEERNLLRTLIDSLPDSVYVKDTESRFLIVNKEAARRLGAAMPEEVVGKTDFDFYPERLTEGYFSDEQEILRTGQPLFNREELVIDQTTGARIWNLATKVPFRDSQGRIVGIVGTGRNITERKQMEEALRYRLELEELISTISARLINLAPAETDSAISNDVLRPLGLFAGVDRAYVFQLSSDGATISNTHEWCAEGITPQMETLQGLDAATPSWWMDRLRRLETIHIPRLADLPPEADALKGTLQAQGIKSLLAVPLVYRKSLLGYLGFDSVRMEKSWTEEDISTLKVVSEIVASALERKRAEIERERLLSDLERRALQLQTAAEVSRTAGTILDSDELIRQAVDLIRERFNLYYAGLFLVEEGGERPGRWAVLRAGTGEAGRQMLEQGHRLAVGGESMIGWCIANKQARIALDVGEEAIRFDNPLLPETRSEMALPLISRGQVIGALTIQSAQEAAFSREDIAILQIMADQLANAIVNVRQFEALSYEQSLMNALMDNIPDYIYFKDRDSRFLRISRAHARSFGLDDPAEAIGKTDFDFFAEEHARPAYEDEQRIIRTGQPILGLEERETWPDRPDTWVLTSKLPLRDREGNIIGTFGISSDITPRKRVEEALARRARQEQLIREIGDKMRRAVEMDNLMQITVRELSTALGAEVFLQLATPPASAGEEEAGHYRPAAARKGNGEER